MYTVYKILSEKNEKGNWYEKYDIPIGIPVPPDCVLTPIPGNIKNPKYDFAKDEWVEDQEALIKNLKEENQSLREKIELNEMALVDAINMLSDMIMKQP